MIGADVVLAPVGPDRVWSAWGGDPLVVVALSVAVILYGRGYRRARLRRSRTADRRAACFAVGILATAVALLSPLDAMSQALFSAHMVQHLVLIVVAAPMCVLARPVLTILAGLPPSVRAPVARIASRIAAPFPARALRRPGPAWALGTIALWGWHLPTLYRAAVLDPTLHALEHASFLLTSMLVWRVALERPRREAAALGRALFLLASALQSALLGALLVFASTPLYPVHGTGPAAWGLTPLADQQLAGALMWIPPAAVYLSVAAAIAIRAFRDMDRRADAAVGRERAAA